MNKILPCLFDQTKMMHSVVNFQPNLGPVVRLARYKNQAVIVDGNYNNPLFLSYISINFAAFANLFGMAQAYPYMMQFWI